MTITVVCNACGTKLTVADSHAGKKGRCPLCEAIIPITVPEPPVIQPGTPASTPIPPQPTSGANASVKTSFAAAPLPAAQPPLQAVAFPEPIPKASMPVPPPAAPVKKPTPKLVPAIPSEAQEAFVVAQIVEPLDPPVLVVVNDDAPVAEVKPAAPSPLRPLESSDVRRMVFSGFRSEFVPVKSSDAYRMGLVFSTAFMLMLPVVYMVLLTLPGFLLWLGLRLFMPESNVAMWGLVLPVVLVLTLSSLFLILKPILFAESAASHTRTITPQGEPLLFEFVYRVCDLVKAPRPRQIEINCDINAFASFRLGWLSLLSKDFSLTLGMPLVAGLSLQQFAGVLAHEFGHFSQGSAMRLTFLMRSINWWMVHAVYVRDRADDVVEDMIRSHTILTLVGLTAKALMAVPRWIMWLMLRAGHLVVGNMLQQMEFDADRYESHLVGSETFKSTCRQICVVQIAWEGAQQDMAQYYRDGRLVNNLPRLIMENVSQIPPKVLKLVEQRMAETKTQMFDSHPSDTDRVANVEREPQAGVFHSTLPAMAVFADFESIAKGVSYDFYKEYFGDKVDSKPLLPVEDLLARLEQDKITWDALDRYFLDTFSELRPLVLPNFYLEPPTNANFLLEQLKVARLHILHHLVVYRSAFEEYLNAHNAGLEAVQARVLFQAGLSFPSDQFTNSFRDLYDVARVDSFAREEQARLDPVLRPLETAAGARLFAGLTLLFEPQVAARITHAAAFQQEVRTLMGVVALVAQNWSQLLGLIGQDVTADTLFTYGANQETSRQFGVLAVEAFEGAHRSLIYFRNLFEQLEYPFDHVEGRMTISHYLLRVVPMPRDYQGVAEATRDVVNGLQTMYNRSVARLCAIAEIVEQNIGLEPLVDPAPKPDKDDVFIIQAN